jgi:hypothetical protein
MIGWHIQDRSATKRAAADGFAVTRKLVVQR